MKTATPQTERKQFWIDVPFQKSVDAKSGDIMLEGYASTWTEDRDGEEVDPQAFDESLPDFMGKNPILLWQHCQDYPLGQILSARVDEHGLLVKAVITKPSAGEEGWRHTSYEQVKRGVVRTFSIGGFFWREISFPLEDDADYEPRIIIYKVELFEISVVSIPSNPDSLYSAAVKSVKGAAVGPMLTPRTRNQMAELIGMRALEDAELLAMTEDERDARFKGLQQLYRRSGLVPPERDAWTEACEKAVDAPSPQAKLAATLGPLMLTLGFVKSGRAISKGNEDKLRSALSTIQSVLDALGPAEDPTDGARSAPGAGGEAAGSGGHPGPAALTPDAALQLKELGRAIGSLADDSLGVKNPEWVVTSGTDSTMTNGSMTITGNSAAAQVHGSLDQLLANDAVESTASTMRDSMDKRTEELVDAIKGLAERPVVVQPSKRSVIVHRDKNGVPIKYEEA